MLISNSWNGGEAVREAFVASIQVFPLTRVAEEQLQLGGFSCCGCGQGCPLQHSHSLVKALSRSMATHRSWRNLQGSWQQAC